jgi:hypothetical protein
MNNTTHRYHSIAWMLSCLLLLLSRIGARQGARREGEEGEGMLGNDN